MKNEEKARGNKCVAEKVDDRVSFFKSATKKASYNSVILIDDCFDGLTT